MEKRLNGLITGVISGDHMMIQGAEKGDEPPSDKEVFLAYIEAPRMATPQREGDPFGFAAREFSRRQLIGKRVSFIPEHKHDNKDFVTIWVEKEEGEIDLAAELIRHGLAKLRIREKRNEERCEELRELQEEAKDKEIGIWAEENDKVKNVGKILFMGAPGYSIEEVFNGIKKEGGKTQGIVEYQLRTSIYSVLLVKYKTVVRIVLDYLQDLPGEPKATAQEKKINKRAKAFADRAVMSKDVTVAISSFEPGTSNISGRILLPDGNDLATELLSNGYSKLRFQTPEMDIKYYTSLRVALEHARAQRKGFWKTAEIKRKSDQSRYTAQVIEVHSGNKITVMKTGSNEEIALSLAGIKAPKPPSKRENTKEEPYYWEAKEFMRKLLIGKKVEIHEEYTRKQKQDEKSKEPERVTTFVTVITPDNNCANLEIVVAGLAEVINPRVDEQLTQYYQQIVDSNEIAKKGKKGKYAVGIPPTHSHQSLIGNVNTKTISYYQDWFRKIPNVEGVVEYCVTPSKIRVRVDQANCLINFICQGLQPIQSDANVPELQNIFAQGQKFARRTLLQRNVKLVINSSDKKGAFFGTLFVNGNDYAISLLEEGLVGLKKSGSRGYLPAQSQKKDKYEEAEEVAKKSKKGIWNPKNSVILDLIFSEANEFEEIEGKDKIEIVRIVNNRYFYASLIDEKITKKIESAIGASFNPSKSEKLLMPIRPGTYCMALYSEDKKWYRGQIERMTSDNTCEIFFLDYGNSEFVNVNNIKKIDLKLIKDFPPCAFKFGLAYLKMPPLEAKVHDKPLRELLDSQLEGKELTVMYKYKEGGIRYGILIEGGNIDYMKSFNAYLIKRGLARISTEVQLPEGLKEWIDMQNEAQNEPRGFWETGRFEEYNDND